MKRSRRGIWACNYFEKRALSHDLKILFAISLSRSRVRVKSKGHHRHLYPSLQKEGEEIILGGCQEYVRAKKILDKGHMKRIGIIGVGLLGSAVASRLLKRKFTVKGYDTRPKQVKALQPRGLVMTRSIAEVAADADVLFTILPSLESVETTILGAGGLIETLPSRATLIQMSTISPELARRLAKAVTAKRLGFLDAPMSGTSAMVE